MHSAEDLRQSMLIETNESLLEWKGLHIRDFARILDSQRQLIGDMMISYCRAFVMELFPLTILRGVVRRNSFINYSTANALPSFNPDTTKRYPSTKILRSHLKLQDYSVTPQCI